jgi:membrane protein DedA with SNARE-associated domain
MISNWISIITIWFTKIGYWGVFFACLGLFPAEIVITMDGATMSNHLLEIAVAAGLGEMIGAWPTYLIGLFFSNKDILKFLKGKGKFLKISEDSYHNGYKSIQNKGIGYVFFSRFIPWVRVVSAVVAGFVRFNIIIFSLAVFAGTFIYAYAFAYIGTKIGNSWDNIQEFYR